MTPPVDELDVAVLLDEEMTAPMDDDVVDTDDALIALSCELLENAIAELEEVSAGTEDDAELGIGLPPVGVLETGALLSPPPPPPHAVNTTLMDSAHRVRNA